MANLWEKSKIREEIFAGRNFCGRNFFRNLFLRIYPQSAKINSAKVKENRSSAKIIFLKGNRAKIKGKSREIGQKSRENPRSAKINSAKINENRSSAKINSAKYAVFGASIGKK